MNENHLCIITMEVKGRDLRTEACKRLQYHIKRVRGRVDIQQKGNKNSRQCGESACVELMTIKPGFFCIN